MSESLSPIEAAAKDFCANDDRRKKFTQGVSHPGGVLVMFRVREILLNCIPFDTNRKTTHAKVVKIP